MAAIIITKSLCQRQTKGEYSDNRMGITIFLLFLGLILHMSMVTEAAANEPNSNCGCTAKSEEQPSSPSKGKLINCNDIMKGFEEGQGRVKVIVNLAEPAETKARTDWHSKHSLKLLQDEIKATQVPVLSALSEGEFKLRYSFDNQAGFSGEVTLQGLEKLKNDPRVISVEPVYLLELHLRHGIPLIHADTYRLSYNGAGIAIAICDTGIDYRHPMLGGGGFPNNKVIGGYDFGDDDDDPIPQSEAHGTCCAGIAAGDLGTVGDYIGGVAYNAKLYALKVEDSSGNIYDDYIISAWDWCVTHKDDDPCHPILVISNSFGGGRYFSTCDSTSPSMTQAANNAVAAGITVLVSSGNDGYCDSIAWPACISNVISVGAVYDAAFGTYQPCVNVASCATKYFTTQCTGWYAIDNTVADMVTSYSNTASFLTVLAPSNQCYTTDIISSGGYSSGDYYSAFGGTSAACPYTAGTVACLQSAAKTIRGSYLSPSEVRTILTSMGDNITDGKVAITKPRINLERAINNLLIGSPPTANSINVTTPLNTAITIAFQATDDGLPNPPSDLNYIITSLPTNGSLSDPGAGGITAVPYTVAGNGNQVVYTPTTGYSGPDSFQYKANDGGVPPDGGDSNIAAVSISVIYAIYMANMDTNPGWTLDSLWQWGTPTGSGGEHGNHDPTAGYTGAKVVGYNLLGDYENSITSTRWAKTPAINCTNRTGVTLTFYRWLNVEQPLYDHAYIQVSNNGSSWSTIWENSSGITDSSWAPQTFDISAIADNQPTVYIRWGMGPTDSSWQYSGWNIDDVKVTGIAPQMQTLTISSSPGGSTIPASGTYQYSNGTVVDINAIPDLHYHFVNWTGTAVTAGKVSNPNSPSTTVLMDANYAVQANFAIDQRSLTTSTTAGGTVTTPGIGTYWYNHGTNANIVASAIANYHFVNWTGTAVTAGKVANPNSPSTTVLMDADYTVQAHFAESQYTLTVNIAGSGYVTIYPNQPTYHYGDTVYLTAHPAVGWYLSEWSGDVSGNEYLKKITMDGSKIITANFAVIRRTISGHVTEPDYITPVEGVAIDATNGGGSDTTDADGYYELTVDYGWSGTVTLHKTGYTFDPNGTVYSNVTTDQSNDYIAILDTFIISGHAIDSTTLTPLADVLVTPDNNGGPYTSKYYGGGSDTTDVNGYYEVLVDYNWSGNVVSSKYAYTFEPNSMTYANVTQDVEDQNYVGMLLTYRITGYIKEANLVPIAAVLVSADNSGGSDTTDANGYYEVQVGYGWSGRVIPSKYAYAFQPGSITYANVTQDQQEQNYVGTPSDHRITGCIKNACQVPTAGVYVEANNGGGSDVTDANGSYEVWVGHNYNWSGTVTPSKAHYIFDPNGRAYTNVIEDETGQDYTANNIYDLDCDGSIGFGDVSIISENWLKTGPDVPGDFDADEMVNFLDFAVFGNVWQDR